MASRIRGGRNHQKLLKKEHVSNNTCWLNSQAEGGHEFTTTRLVLGTSRPMEPAEVQHKVRTSLISNKNQWTPCDDIKPYPDLYFSTTFDLCSLEASPVSFWEICPIYYIKALKEVITIMVSSFILSKLSFLAVDLKKEPWKGWALSEATIKFWVLLAALSNCFFWKKSCTLCNDSSAITRTKNDHTGSWSSSWGVLCSRTLISEASGWRWKISNTVIWIHLLLLSYIPDIKPKSLLKINPFMCEFTRETMNLLVKKFLLSDQVPQFFLITS